MHRATKKSGLTKSADGSIARRTRSCCARPGEGRHVGLDKKCLLMEVRSKDGATLGSPTLQAEGWLWGPRDGVRSSTRRLLLA
jgi:hypothetical protein